MKDALHHVQHAEMLLGQAGSGATDLEDTALASRATAHALMAMVYMLMEEGSDGTQ